ncbi:hypothetical protein [Microbacterium sp.]|uniref:hypothetical protein n=1 Tax=Microbacterium sp. TaxID=51671 RepID=UPI00273306DB|nr:hypothetical protein [Microbacterium sp.]MDP3949090.1 hypothetical protein [Microbacterium sp.]
MSDSVAQARLLRHALRQLGWLPAGTFRDQVEYWEPANDNLRGPIHEVILPIGEQRSDSDSLTSKAAAALQGEYGQEFLHTLKMVELMISKQLDEVLLRRATSDGLGLISWDDGNSMVSGARGLLSAAAKATSRRRRRFANTEAPIADAFLRQCLMGQTKVGSYVVTALTPTYGKFSTSASADEKAKSMAPAFDGRTITGTLQTALGAVTAALEESRGSDSVEAFDAHVEDGISLELVRSLVQIVGEVESSVTLHYNEVETLDVPGNDRTGQVFEFTPPDAVVLVRAARYLAEAPEPKVAALTGEVVDLKKWSARPERSIQLLAKVDGTPRVVTVALTVEQYDKALEAHRLETKLSVTGELEIRARGSAIVEATYVKVESIPVKRPKKSETASTPAIWESDAFE